MRILISIFLSLFFLTIFYSYLHGAGSMLRQEIKIVVYQQGKKITLSHQAPHFSELQQICEEFLSSATNVMRDFITKEKVLLIKKRELAIEIIYQKSKEVDIPHFNKVLKASHLLIPLTGDNITDNGTCVFFYGPNYGPDYIGPHWTQRDVMEIRQLLISMGIDIKQEEGKRR